MITKNQSPPQPYELSAAQKRYDRRKRFWRWVRTLGLCLIFYLLSTGPVCRLVDDGRLPEKARQAYTPLAWAGAQDWGTWLDGALRYYVSDIWHAPPLKWSPGGEPERHVPQKNRGSHGEHK